MAFFLGPVGGNSVVAAERQRTRDALEGDGRVVGVLEPVEAPVAPGFEGRGEGVALAPRGDAAVLGAPPGGGRAVLGGAGVEDAEAAAGHLGGVSGGVLILAKVTTRIRRLHDHLLARHRAARKGQLVAGTAPARLRPTRYRDRSVSICQAVRDGPWALIRAHVGWATVVAGGLGVWVGEHVVVLVTGLHGAALEGGLACPGAGWLAAVPVAGCLPRAGDGEGGGGEEEGEEGEEDKSGVIRREGGIYPNFQRRGNSGRATIDTNIEDRGDIGIYTTGFYMPRDTMGDAWEGPIIVDIEKQEYTRTFELAAMPPFSLRITSSYTLSQFYQCFLPNPHHLMATHGPRLRRPSPP
ncbi:hypothetical protein V500_09447 [Pseudogymnoascus sp. VKM F-4518 (FW-2643)]|nr:hypothetical protein V500_09447 [Pseudogymnoascus sp. VKM F-4518 (FW-2643)]